MPEENTKNELVAAWTTQTNKQELRFVVTNDKCIPAHQKSSTILPKKYTDLEAKLAL